MTRTINDELLTKVTGGDWGDSNYEHDNGIQLYNVGDYVEVYTDHFHLFTMNAKVQNVSSKKVITNWHNWNEIEVPFYKVRFTGGDRTEWISSDWIERK